MKPVLQASRLSRRYGARTLFEDVTFTLHREDRIGVIGRNGAGKSSLLRILTGEEEPDTGEVIYSRDTTIAYLQQRDPYKYDETVLEFLERTSGYPEWDCARIAARLGIDQERLHTTIGELSGGYRMRAKLAGLLVREPDFLLLDEPTNYLDLETLLFLETFLQSAGFGYMIVSHDRDFLMSISTSTMEVENEMVTLFPGDLEGYLQFKSENRDILEKTRKNTEARRKELLQFAERFGAKASKAAQARSKIRMAERLQKIELPDPPPDVTIRIPDPSRFRRVVMQIENLSAGYDAAAPVLTGVTADLEAGHRYMLAGNNGQGKSTLLRTLAGKLPMLAGSIRTAPELTVGFFAQHVYEELPEDRDVISAIQRLSPRASRQAQYDMAGAFLFSGDALEKPVKVLSGGERARLLLAGLLLSAPELLLLDEPNNHLDFQTVEALAHALRNFRGCAVIVSHDRTFARLAATDLLVIDSGRVIQPVLGIDDYIAALREGVSEPRTANNREATGKKDKPAKAGKLHDNKPADNERLRKQLENQMLELQCKIGLLEQEIAGGSYSPEKARTLADLQSALQETESNWLLL